MSSRVYDGNPTAPDKESVASATEPGLTSAEAALRLAQVGPNEPVRVHHFSAIRQLVRLFINPLVLILLVASLVSASLGQQADALIIVSMVLLGVGINFWQTDRSQRAAERLRASVLPTATVQRDGQWVEIPVRQVVPGDVFRLSAGDLVPADARLVESRDLSVQQSTLTGESLPVSKDAAIGESPDGEGPDAPHLVFLGTSVVSGTATAVVVATGPRTVFGDIAERLAARAPETRVRARPAAIQPADPPHDDRPGAVHPARWPRAACAIRSSRCSLRSRSASA